MDINTNIFRKGTYRISLVDLFRALTPFPLINPKKKFCGEALLYGSSTQKKISKFYVVKFCDMMPQSFSITIHKSWKYTYFDRFWFLMYHYDVTLEASYHKILLHKILKYLFVWMSHIPKRFHEKFSPAHLRERGWAP